MPDPSIPPVPPLHGAIVQDVLLVDRIERAEPGPFVAASLPGHLIHVVLEGDVEQSAAGVAQCFGAGSAIWYHDNEPVQGRVRRAPWVFYTVNFRAPSLPPPPLHQRVTRVTPQTVEHMRRLLQAWRAADVPPLRRHLRTHALLLEVLAALLPHESNDHRADQPAQLWWSIETALRRSLSEPIDLGFIQRLSRRSQRSIIRACHLATGLSPMKRVKQLRLSYARGLVQLSEFSMSDIAFRVGYSRVQELSRDYRKAFGVTPTQDRKAGPTYARREQ